MWADTFLNVPPNLFEQLRGKKGDTCCTISDLRILRPGDVARPEAVDNSQFICEHGLLAFDPNVSGDLDASMTIIKRSDWDALEELYVACLAYRCHDAS